MSEIHCNGAARHGGDAAGRWARLAVPGAACAAASLSMLACPVASVQGEGR